MSLEVFLSHTGKRYDIDVSQIPTLEDLKEWIAQHVDVSVGRQILMTGTGKNVKQQHLVNHGQVFVYDKQFLAGEEPQIENGDETKDTASLSDPPSELENENSLAAWQELFKSRRAWALEALEQVRALSEDANVVSAICENIDRSTNVALENLKSHVTSLQNMFDKTQAWAQDTIQEHAEVLREWPRMTETLKELPARDDIARLMQSKSDNNGAAETAGTMHMLLDVSSLDNAATTLETSSSEFKEQVDKVTKAMGQLNIDSNQTSKLVAIEWPNLETDSLVQEAETLAKKIDGDYNDVLRAANDTKAISKISRVAAAHTNDMLPGLQEVFLESLQVLVSAREQKIKLAKVCHQVLKAVSRIQATLASLQSQTQKLALSDDGQDSLDVLDHVFRLPSAYGSVLIEAIRRSEWNDRTVADLKSLKDELSQHKDDELRRRKKWTNNMSTFLNQETVSGSTSANALSDFTFSTPSNPWPFVSREEIFSYVDDLRALEIDDAVQQVTQQLRDLDAPARSRRPRPRPFKNGSIHDAMQNSFVRNGSAGPEVRALQDDKSRLEDKLKASESRIRKLEDLLHRQSQSQSTSAAPGSTFTPIAPNDFERPPTSPGPDSRAQSYSFDPSSRRSSVSAAHQIQGNGHVRRPSNSNPATDEKALVQKILQLESQIQTFKNESEGQMKAVQEAESIKQDLLANFEAQRAEFDDERQKLEDDNHELKIKIEEFEEELDRVMGSREHEKAKSEGMLSHLRSELERLRKTSIEDTERYRNTKENHERELHLHKERNTNAETQLGQLRDERRHLQDRNLELAKKMRTIEDQQTSILGTLQSVHEQLSPAGSAPDDLKRLVGALDVLAEGAAIHARGLDDALQLATAQGKANEEKIEQLERQLKNLQTTKNELDEQLSGKNEQLRAAQHPLDTARAELADERRHIERLQAQFAAGETGSDALRARLTEEEHKVIELTDAKDKAEVQVEVLQQNVKTLREDVDRLNETTLSAKNRLLAREKRAKDLSERLFQHNDRMVRMLESFGYSITREGAGLLIQRASKVNASQMLSETSFGTPMKRQISGSVPTQHYSEPTDAHTIYWTHEEDDKVEEAKYNAFLSALSRVDIDSTVELITKRYKDVETLAKKYQKDSRLHREKTNRLQSEAHEKIAYRGFKEGDLALFLPTRNQATKPWAAFNIGAPHYFLKETDSHRLQARDWLLARISKVDERVVDLSRSLGNASMKGNAEASDGGSLQSVDDNPFELSDGLRWYLVEASEEKPGAPSTPGLGKSTVAASVIEVKAQIGRKSSGAGGKDSDKNLSAVNAAKTLHKSLDSRRSSEASRKSAGPILKPSTSNNSALAQLATTDEHAVASGTIPPAAPVRPSDADAKQGRAREDDKIFDVAQRNRPAFQRVLSDASTGVQSSGSRAFVDDGNGQKRMASPGKSQKPWDRLFSFQFQA